MASLWFCGDFEIDDSPTPMSMDTFRQLSEGYVAILDRLCSRGTLRMLLYYEKW